MSCQYKLSANKCPTVTQVMLYGDSESWAQQSTLIHAVFHWYGENLRAKFNGNLRMVGHCDVRKQRRALSALANFVQCSWCTLATFQLSDWFVAMVNIPFIWYNVYIYIILIYTHACVNGICKPNDARQVSCESLTNSADSLRSVRRHLSVLHLTSSLG